MCQLDLPLRVLSISTNYFNNLTLSILRDAVNELALHFLAKMKILVVRDVEREDVEFISRVSTLWVWH